MKNKVKFRDLQKEEIERNEEETDSETEALQEAFAKGILKPGLNIPVTQRKFTNNVPQLKQYLATLSNDLPWIERLDVIGKPAPLAPELSVQLEESEKTADSFVHNDFKRESYFYRQAQDAVLSVLPKLKDLGVKTQRPLDYFAEMAKSDDHMNKVKHHLIKRKEEMERIEKVRSMRSQKKLQKALNAQAKVAKQIEKNEFMSKVKKFRKGETKDLSFLEGKGKKPVHGKSKRSMIKKAYKESKFGFGGKKRHLKKNTKESTYGDDRKSTKKKSVAAKRPGKWARKKAKAKKNNS